MELVKMESISKNYGNFTALTDINIVIEKGKIYGLLGPNGAGKSTLIKLLNGLIQPTSGKITIDGKSIGVESKKIISYLPERTYLDNSVKVMYTIKYFKDFYEDFDENKAIKLLNEMSIPLNKKVSQLSKGMKEKLQLILVLSRNAELYILDEPIAGVDPVARDEILDTILRNFNPGAALIISTHLISDIERILDDVIFINQSVLLQDTADNVRSKYDESILESFKTVFKEKRDTDKGEIN